MSRLHFKFPSAIINLKQNILKFARTYITIRNVVNNLNYFLSTKDLYIIEN